MIEIRRMQIDDLDQVMEIENATFSVPWTETGYFTFLLRNDTLFLVAEEEGKILGYCGALMVLDEADVTNVAVTEERPVSYTHLDVYKRQAWIRSITLCHSVW